jgi:hypothetical protein
MKSVYSAVRTGPLNKAACAPSLKGLTLLMNNTSSSNCRYISLTVTPIVRLRKVKTGLNEANSRMTVHYLAYITCHEGTEGKERYTSTLALTSALDRGG